MKIKTIDIQTKKPVTNMKIQLQVKGQDSGYLTTTTDATGTIQLDDKYAGQQIASTTGGTPGQWITAVDNGTLTVTTTQTTGGKVKQPAGSNTYNK